MPRPKVVIAPDSFKGTLSSIDAAAAIQRGLRRACPSAEAVPIPVADGGEGSLAAFQAARTGRMEARRLRVAGPLGEPVEAAWGMDREAGLAVVEMAQASGLSLVREAERDPLQASTRGTGELLAEALRARPRRLVVCLGGSATVDGGAGMAQALGFRLLDRAGRELAPGGGALRGLVRIEPPSRPCVPEGCRVEAAFDVDSPLLGPGGAAAVFGPQKGATGEAVAVLEEGLARLARCWESDLGARGAAARPGAGAAGGLGAGLVAFLGAALVAGVELVLEAAGLAQALEGAALVVTGEGRIDSQTLRGKTVLGVARRARSAGVPVVVLAGRVEAGWEALRREGVVAALAASPAGAQGEALRRDAAWWLEETAARELGRFLGGAE